MTTAQLEERLIELFEDVKDSFYRPPITGPELIWDKKLFDGEGTAFLHWLKLNIGLNVPFLEELSQKKDLDKIARGLFTHEFGHYHLHPYDFSMQLYLSFQAEKTFKEIADIIYPLYTDFENNCLIIDNDLKYSEDLKETLRATWDLPNKSPIDAAIFTAYNKLIDLGLDIDLSKYENKDKIETAAKELEQILITKSQDYGLQYSQMLRFGQAIEPLIDAQTRAICILLGLATGGGSAIIKPNDVQGLPPDMKTKIDEEMRKILKALPKQLYDEIKKHFTGKEQKADPSKGKGIGTGKVDISLADQKTVDYYKEAIRAFGLYIRPKRTLSISTVNIPAGKDDFKPSDSTVGIDMRFSGGKILPGLTKRTRQEKIPFPATKEVIPGLILYKDASGSMMDPRQAKCYGTIAGGMFATSYLKSRAPVGVVLFDSESSEVFYSMKEDELLARICGYKGGGTTIDMDQLKKDLESKPEFMPLDKDIDPEEIKRNPFFRKYLQKNARITGLDRLKKGHLTDFVIITDGGISNIDELIYFFNENPEYRPTILHTSGFKMQIPGYDGKTSGVYEGITVLKADTREDIVEITKKTLKKNLLSKYRA